MKGSGGPDRLNEAPGVVPLRILVDEMTDPVDGLSASLPAVPEDPPVPLGRHIQEVYLALPPAARSDDRVKEALQSVNAKMNSLESLANTEQLAQQLLRTGLRDAVIACLPVAARSDQDRVDATVAVLMDRSVSPTELASLNRTARLRGITRFGSTYLLSNLASFGVGGAITWRLARTPPVDTADLTKYARKLALRLNFLITYLSSSAGIGVGGELMASTLRAGRADGKAAAKYFAPGTVTEGGKPVPWAKSRAGQVYRAIHMWTFSATHGYIPTLGLKPAESAKAHIAAGATAATVAGLLMPVITQMATDPDPVWLDGRGDKAADLRTHISHLRESSVVATGGYVKDVVNGAVAAARSPSKEILVRALVRFACAFIALSGRIVAAFSDSDEDRLNWNVGTGIFVGLTWGAFLWAHEVLTSPPAPATAATPAQVAEVAPPLQGPADAVAQMA